MLVDNLRTNRLEIAINNKLSVLGKGIRRLLGVNSRVNDSPEDKRLDRTGDTGFFTEAARNGHFTVKRTTIPSLYNPANRNGRMGNGLPANVPYYD